MITDTTSRRRPRLSPIDRELLAGRIPGHLGIVADLFWRDFSTASRPVGGTYYRPRESRPDALVGSEHTADAALVCRFLAGRLGHLYTLLIDALIMDAPLDQLAGSNFPGQSTSDAIGRGRARVVDALILAGQAYDDWHAMIDGHRPRTNYALGDVSPEVLPSRLAAANDNARTVGNRVHASGLARVKESAALP